MNGGTINILIVQYVDWRFYVNHQLVYFMHAEKLVWSQAHVSRISTHCGRLHFQEHDRIVQKNQFCSQGTSNSQTTSYRYRGMINGNIRSIGKKTLLWVMTEFGAVQSDTKNAWQQRRGPLKSTCNFGKKANTAVVVEWRIAWQYEYITAVDFKTIIFQPLLWLLKHVEEGLITRNNTEHRRYAGIRPIYFNSNISKIISRSVSKNWID